MLYRVLAQDFDIVDYYVGVRRSGINVEGILSPPAVGAPPEKVPEMAALLFIFPAGIPCWLS